MPRINTTRTHVLVPLPPPFTPPRRTAPPYTVGVSRSLESSTLSSRDLKVPLPCRLSRRPVRALATASSSWNPTKSCSGTASTGGRRGQPRRRPARVGQHAHHHTRVPLSRAVLSHLSFTK